MSMGIWWKRWIKVMSSEDWGDWLRKVMLLLNKLGDMPIDN
jgi:hypothetical protein